MRVTEMRSISISKVHPSFDMQLYETVCQLRTWIDGDAKIEEIDARCRQTCGVSRTVGKMTGIVEGEVYE